MIATFSQGCDAPGNVTVTFETLEGTRNLAQVTRVLPAASATPWLARGGSCLAIDVVVRAVVKHDADVVHRVAGEDAGRERFPNSPWYKSLPLTS